MLVDAAAACEVVTWLGGNGAGGAGGDGGEGGDGGHGGHGVGDGGGGAGVGTLGASKLSMVPTFTRQPMAVASLLSRRIPSILTRRTRGI